MRTVTVAMTYMLGTALLAGGCTREESAGSGKREAVILSIAEANYGASGGARRSATAPANGGAPQTRAIVDGGGSTFFTDRDRLGLFLRGDGYEDVDNRIVQLDYPGEGPRKKWNITGEVIPLYADAATVTAYFPYSDDAGLTMSAIPLLSGPYDVNTNDVVWQRDTVHSTHTQAMFLEMQHAMTRVKIRLNRGTSDTSDPGDYAGEGKITGVRIADAEDVAADDRVVYLDGTLDLTQATPVVTPGWPDAVADKSEKTLTAEGVLYDLLLLPVDKIDAGKVMLEVELDGKSLSAPFPVDAVDKWEAGKAYTYEVAVRNGAAQVVFGKATVTPWNDGGSISGSLDPSKPEYGGGDVQDWGDNEWGAEEGDDEPVTGEIADASLVPPPTDNVIPLEGGEYSVRLTGNWTGSVSVRMSVGGNIGGLLHAACSNGAATVTFTVPANANSSRTVTFEYLWNGTWTKIGRDCTQQGYNVTAATHNAPATIPGQGGSYNVTLTGYLPSSVSIRAQSGGTAIVSGTVAKSGTAVSLAVPANQSFDARTVTFEYQWNGTWTKIGDRTQQGYNVSNATHNAPVSIPTGGGSYNVTLTGHLPSSVSIRALSGSSVLVSGTVTRSGTAVSLAVPANQSFDARTVTFEYQWNGTWTKIGDRTQQGYNVSNATHNAPVSIPTGGGSYNVTLTGVLPAAGVDVRAQSGGTALVAGKVTASGTAVSLTVPANATGADRTVTFEYNWNGTWTKIGDAHTQQGYNVSNATHNAPATIPGQGGSYNVTLTGVLPAAGVEVRATISGANPVTGKVTASGTAVSLTIPGQLSYDTRTVTFEYNWNGTWTRIGNACTQQGWHVTKASVSPAGDIPGAGGTYTVTLEGWGGYQVRAMSGSTELAIKTDYTEVANYSASIAIPDNPSTTATRNVTFQYRFKGTWTDIETRTQDAAPPRFNPMNFSNCQTRCASDGGIPTRLQLKSLDWTGWIEQVNGNEAYYWASDEVTFNSASVWSPDWPSKMTGVALTKNTDVGCRCRND